MGTGASLNPAGAGNVIPELETFRMIAGEYDKLKSVGLSVEEMHLILQKRTGAMVSSPVPSPLPAHATVSCSGDNLKDDGGSRPPEATINHAAPSSNQQPAAAVKTEEVSNGIVLLIDDSPVAAKVATKVLVSQKFEVLTANSAQKGYEILQARKDDIVLLFLDVVMPEIDGVECLGWIKDNPELANVPVYMLSGLEDQLLSDVCMERGAERMLLKPLNPTVVQELIKENNIKPVSTAPVTGLPRNASVPVPAQINTAAAPTTSRAQSVESKSDPMPLQQPSQQQQQQQQKSDGDILSVGDTLTPFKLCDSDFKKFSFPSLDAKGLTFLVFIPTVYCTELYENGGFFNSLFDVYDELVESGNHVYCITADLPFALQAAKLRFSLPFMLLSDPSLIVSNALVGTIDIGKMLSKPNDDDAPDFDHHQINSFMGPKLSIVLLNEGGIVCNRWIAPIKTSDEGDVVFSFRSFPSDISEWSGQATISQPAKDPAPAASLCESVVTNQKVNKTPEVRNLKTQQNDADRSAQQKNENSESEGSKAIDSEPATTSILIVDDSSVSLRMVSKRLQMMDFDVTVAYNGQMAYDVLKKAPKKFSIVLSDVVMPVCDGLEFLRMVKADEDLLHLPIVMLSGLEGEALARNCMEAGAASLMKKPFDEVKFNEIVKKVIKK